MDLPAYFSERRAAGHKLLAPYLCAGFPQAEATLPLLHALADGGADLIELGVPFSDPLADGPVLQAASLRALRNGTTLETVLRSAELFHRERPEVPLLLMGYVNPVLAFGRERFVSACERAGIAGLLIPDLPPEAWSLLQEADGPPLIPFAALNTPVPRLRELGKLGAPFLYAVSVLGVTGTRDQLGTEVAAFLETAQRESGLPALAGFGVSRPEQAAELAQHCDGVILGSALARVMEGVEPSRAASVARDFLAPFRQALDAREVPCC